MSLWALRAVDCPYPLLERLKLLIAAQDGIVTDTEFSAAVRVHFRLPEGKVSSFDAALTELSAGSMAAEELGEEFLPGLRE